MRRFIAALCFLISLAQSGAVNDWTYYEEGDHGPGEWSNYFPMCGGSRQSPIDIVDDDVIEDTELRTLLISGYNQTAEFKVKNNGHTIVAHKSENETNFDGYIEHGGLSGRYDFHNVHIHWGSSDDNGSEHTVNGQTYPAEVHFVNMRGDGDSRSFAALGVFVQLGSANNTGYQKLIDVLQNITFRDEVIDGVTLNLADLLPVSREQLIRYEGSLTTPHCNETVTWTVFKDPVLFSSAQLSALRKLRTNVKNDTPLRYLVDNFRPVQPLNGRQVTAPYSNQTAAITTVSPSPTTDYSNKTTTDSAAVFKMQMMFLISCLIMAAFVY